MKQYKPYPAYKASGIDWLGEIPEHWKTLRINQFTQVISEKNHPKEELLSVYRDYGVVLKSSRSDNNNKAGEDLSSYKLVKPGYLVLNKMKTWQGSLGVSQLKGIVSPAYITCRITKAYVDGKYLHNLLRSKDFIDQYNRYSYGVRTDQWDMRYEDFKNIEALIPSINEQTKIARFLDHKTREIDEFISLKEKEIALLKERKTAIINHAVTKGLKPRESLKDSGIPWLREIPAHWKTLSVKQLAAKRRKTFTDGDWIESPYITNSGVRLIQTGNVGKGVYREKGFRYISEDTFDDFKCTELFPKDVLICRLDGPVGRACEVPNLGVRMITSVDNTILKVNSEILSTYIVFLMTSSLWLEWIQSLCRAGGGFRFRISRSALGNLSVPVPPFDEQKSISEFLETELAQIDLAISHAQKEIDLIKEYRQRLISDAVTGKIDVRDWKPATKEYVEPELEPLMTAEPKVSYGKPNAEA